MVCYRRHGHNEGDDPSYTQPLMYKRIDARRSVRKLYTEALVKRGDISHRGGRAGARRLPAPAAGRARRDPRSTRRPSGDVRQAAAAAGRRAAPRRHRRRPGDARPRSTRRCRHAARGLHRPPEAGQAVRDPRQDVRSDGEVDWALGEAMAFGSLLLEGTDDPLRRPGHPARHVLATATRCSSTTRPATSTRRSPTSAPTRASSGSTTRCCRSTPRSASSTATRSSTRTRSSAGRRSSATSSTAPRSSSTSTSWPPRTSGARRRASCCCCPTATRARAPSTRSARIERFLTLCAEDNIQVANATTAAQYFHLLRRQVRRDGAQAAGRLHAEVAAAGQAVALAGRGAHARARSRRCSTTRRSPTRRGAAGRVLLGQGRRTTPSPRRDELGAPAAVVRVEQLYPWPVRRSSPRSLAPLPERHASWSGSRRSPRTWALERSSRAASTSARRPTASDPRGQPRPSRAARPPAPTPSTSRSRTDPRPQRSPRCSPANLRGWSRQREAHHRLELGEGVVGVDDLDRGHAHARAAGLRLTPRSSRNTASVGSTLERARRRSRRSAGRACARRPCSTRPPRRTAASTQPSARGRRGRRRGHEVVGEQRGREPLAGTGARPRPSPGGSRPTSSASTSRAVDRRGRPPRPRPRTASQNSSKSTSLRSSRAQALVSGFVALSRRMKPVGQAVLVLVAVERLERAREDHAAEVEEGCGDRPAAIVPRSRPRRQRPEVQVARRASHSSVESRSDSTSIALVVAVEHRAEVLEA